MSKVDLKLADVFLKKHLLCRLTQNMKRLYNITKAISLAHFANLFNNLATAMLATGNIEGAIITIKKRSSLPPSELIYTII